MKTGEGQVRPLLLYEAKLTNILKGPCNNFSHTLSSIFSFMKIKAVTPEDHLLVDILSKKAISEYVNIFAGIINTIDDKFDVEGEIKKAVDELKRQQTPKSEEVAK